MLEPINTLPVFLWGSIWVGLCVLVGQFTVLSLQVLALLSHSLEILFFLSEFLLQIADLWALAGLIELIGILSAGLGVTLILLELSLELEGFEDL